MPRFTILRHEIGRAFSRQNAGSLEAGSQQNGVAIQRNGDQPANDSVASGPVAGGAVHWDWLFETDATAGSDSYTLKTFATDELVTMKAEAILLPRHRKVYLDFEGDIGKDRGVVRQLASGRYEPTIMNDDRMECRLCPDSVNHLGEMLPAWMVIVRMEESWQLTLSSPGPAEAMR